MSFEVHGRLDGHDRSVVYDEGRLSGSDDVVQRVHAVLADREAVRLSPQDEDRAPEAGDPLAALAAIQEAFDEITSVEGDYPIPGADQSAS